METCIERRAGGVRIIPVEEIKEIARRNGVPVVNSTHSNEYVTTVTFRIDTSDMIFYKSTTLVTVGYESALGYTDSTLIVIYNEDV